MLSAHEKNAWPLFTNTTEHEFGHQFLGDVYTQRTMLMNFLRDYVIDARVFAQSFGDSQQDFRTGVGPRRYAVPLNPEANKPRK